MSEVITNPSPVTPESTQSVQPVVRLACMGAMACNRVCKYNSDVQITDNSEGMPLEKSCSKLAEISAKLAEGTLEATHESNELIGATIVRGVGKLDKDQVEEQSTIGINQLQNLRKSFDDLLMTKLKSASLPRFKVKQAEEDHTKAEESVNSDIPEGLSEDEKIPLLLVRDHARGFYDMHTLKEEGVLFDSYARGVMLQMAEKIALGYHVSLSGEPGVAKTTLAIQIARLNTLAHRDEDDQSNAEPIVLNFSSTKEAESLLVKQTFEDNTLGEELAEIAKAMQDGRGVILDEYNGMTPDQQIFFNDLLLKKPGQKVTLAGQEITIAKGFSVIATSNPLTDTQGNRRQGRQQQDSAGAARFERIDVHYPGSKAYEAAGGNAKEALSRIFMAQWVNHYGWQSVWQQFNNESSTTSLESRSKVVDFISELARLATSPPEESTSLLSSNSALPIISECITPRDFYKLLDYTFASNEDPADKIIENVKVKTDQIVNSNNGHILSVKAKDVIEATKTRCL